MNNGRSLAPYRQPRDGAVDKPRRLESLGFESPRANKIHGLLHRAHDNDPFGLIDVRETVRRVEQTLAGLTKESTVFRGLVDIGDVELDHVWIVADDRVIDVALPVCEPDFVVALRAYVAGDLADDQLHRAAGDFGLESRVVGTFPDHVRYRGLPIWTQR